MDKIGKLIQINLFILIREFNTRRNRLRNRNGNNILHTQSKMLQGYSCIITFDINGKIITEKTKIDSYRQSIDFSCFSKGLYLIKISKNLKFVKTFKVIKN